MGQNQKQQERQNDRKDNKKPYAKPDVTKHGNVEALTQGPSVGPSCPIRIDD